MEFKLGCLSSSLVHRVKNKMKLAPLLHLSRYFPELFGTYWDWRRLLTRRAGHECFQVMSDLCSMKDKVGIRL